MTADINLILQLVQRQTAQVPPAYSSVSPAPALHHTAPPSDLYGAPMFHPATPTTPIEHVKESSDSSTNTVSLKGLPCE